MLNFDQFLLYEYRMKSEESTLCGRRESQRRAKSEERRVKSLMVSQAKHVVTSRKETVGWLPGFQRIYRTVSTELLWGIGGLGLPLLHNNLYITHNLVKYYDNEENLLGISIGGIGCDVHGTGRGSGVPDAADSAYSEVCNDGTRKKDQPCCDGKAGNRDADSPWQHNIECGFDCAHRRDFRLRDIPFAERKGASARNLSVTDLLFDNNSIGTGEWFFRIVFDNDALFIFRAVFQSERSVINATNRH